MIRLDAPIWKKLSSAGNDVDRWLRELMEGKGCHERIMREFAEEKRKEEEREARRLQLILEKRRKKKT